MDPLELRGEYIHCDLNVPVQGSSKLCDRLRLISELGWNCIALSVYVPSGEAIPLPPPLPKETFGLKVFFRITVCFDGFYVFSVTIFRYHVFRFLLTYYQ